MANLLVNWAGDRLLTRSAADAARGQMNQTDAVRAFPAGRLMGYSHAILPTLLEEVTDFLNGLNQEKNRTNPILSSAWQAKDLVSIAILQNYSRNGGQLPAFSGQLTRSFLNDVLHSPELGFRSERLDNIFSQDDEGRGRIRGRDSLLPMAGKQGHQQFFNDQSRHNRQPKSGHRQDFISIMLAALAKHCLITGTVNGQEIMPEVMSLKAAQATTQLQRVKSVLGGLINPGGDASGQLQDELNKLKTASTEMTDKSPVIASPVLSALTEQDVASSRERFMALPIAGQRALLEQSSAIVSDYGWEDYDQRCLTDRQAISGHNPAEQAISDAWSLVVSLFELKQNLDQELHGTMALMDKLRCLWSPDTTMVDKQQLTELFLDCLPPRQNSLYQQAVNRGDDLPLLPFTAHQFDQQRIDHIIRIYQAISNTVYHQFDAELNHLSIMDPGLREELISEATRSCIQNLSHEQRELSNQNPSSEQQQCPIGQGLHQFDPSQVTPSAVKKMVREVLQEIGQEWEMADQDNKSAS